MNIKVNKHSDSVHVNGPLDRTGDIGINMIYVLGNFINLSLWQITEIEYTFVSQGKLFKSEIMLPN